MFTVNKQSDYGLRLMIELCAYNKQNPLSLKSFAEKYNISFLFLQRVARKLRQADLIKATKGSKGGYFLSKNKHKINLRMIFEALEGPCLIIDCLDKEIICPAAKNCSTKKGLNLLNSKIIKSLNSIKLSDFSY